MNNVDLCAWLRENSSGVYQPAAEAATLIETINADRLHLKSQRDAAIADVRSAVETRSLAIVERDEALAEVERLRDYAQLCERWVVHHASKDCITDAEVVNVIRHHPLTGEITASYGETPPDGISELEKLRARVAELEESLSGLVHWHDKAGHIDESWWDGARQALAEEKGKGCPICHGDCSSANPPVSNCPRND